MKYCNSYQQNKSYSIDNNTLAIIENKIINNQSISSDEAEKFLNTIVYLVRHKIYSQLGTFINQSPLSQTMLSQYFESINCPNFACNTTKTISGAIVDHDFIIVSLIIDKIEKKVLIDPMYFYFFQSRNAFQKSSNNNLDEHMSTNNPSYFVKDEDIETILPLLNYGYIELTKDVARIYGDSFYNTKRRNKVRKDFFTIPGEFYMDRFINAEHSLNDSVDQIINNKLLIRTFSDKKLCKTR